MSFSDQFMKIQTKTYQNQVSDFVQLFWKGSKNACEKNDFWQFLHFFQNDFLHQLQLQFSQSFVVVDEFFRPVSENSDKNLSESGFRLGPTFLEGLKKCIWKKTIFGDFCIFFKMIFCTNFNCNFLSHLLRWAGFLDLFWKLQTRQDLWGPKWAQRAPHVAEGHKCPPQELEWGPRQRPVNSSS